MLQYIKVQYSTIYYTYNYGDVLEFLFIIISSLSGAPVLMIHAKNYGGCIYSVLHVCMMI